MSLLGWIALQTIKIEMKIIYETKEFYGISYY